MTDIRKFNELILSRIVTQYGPIKFDDPCCDKITYQECAIPKENKKLFEDLSKHYGLNFTQLYAIEIIKLAVESGITEIKS